MYVSYVSYTPPKPSPQPFIRECAYALNVPTVYNSPLGNPLKLKRLLEGSGKELYYTDRPTLGYKELPLWLWLSYMLFEYVPKSLLFKEPSDPYGLLNIKTCLPLASNMPIVMSFWNLDIPGYSFILGNRINLYYADQCSEPEVEKLIPLTERERLRVYVYSEKGFYFPGDSFSVPATLSVDFFKERAIVFLLKDGKTYRVFDHRSIRQLIDEKGSYRLVAYTYRYRLWRFYFGTRFFFCTPDFYAM